MTKFHYTDPKDLCNGILTSAARALVMKQMKNPKTAKKKKNTFIDFLFYVFSTVHKLALPIWKPPRAALVSYCKKFRFSPE